MIRIGSFLIIGLALLVALGGIGGCSRSASDAGIVEESVEKTVKSDQAEPVREVEETEQAEQIVEVAATLPDGSKGQPVTKYSQGRTYVRDLNKMGVDFRAKGRLLHAARKKLASRRVELETADSQCKVVVGEIRVLEQEIARKKDAVSDICMKDTVYAKLKAESDALERDVVAARTKLYAKVREQKEQQAATHRAAQ